MIQKIDGSLKRIKFKFKYILLIIMFTKHFLIHLYIHIKSNNIEIIKTTQ